MVSIIGMTFLFCYTLFSKLVQKVEKDHAQFEDFDYDRRGKRSSSQEDEADHPSDIELGVINRRRATVDHSKKKQGLAKHDALKEGQMIVSASDDRSTRDGGA